MSASHSFQPGHGGPHVSNLPGLDESQLKEIAGAVFEAVPQQKTQRKVKEVPAEERCMARMWPKETYDDDGNYIYGKPGQCCRRRKDGTVFCAQHAKAAAICTKPLQFTNDGPNGKFKRHGLFHGRVDEELPFHDEKGHLVIFWNTPEVHDWVQAQKEAGTARYTLLGVTFGSVSVKVALPRRRRLPRRTR